MGEVAAVVQSLPRSVFQGEFHRSLTVQALDDLLTIEELRDVDPDHVLYSEGDAPSHLYIVSTAMCACSSSVQRPDGALSSETRERANCSGSHRFSPVQFRTRQRKSSILR